MTENIKKNALIGCKKFNPIISDVPAIIMFKTPQTIKPLVVKTPA